MDSPRVAPLALAIGEPAVGLESDDGFTSASSPLSNLSRSPSPPNYPSPPCSQPSSTGSPRPDCGYALCGSLEDDESRPAKRRRKLPEPVSRETQYLDLHNLPEDLAECKQLQRLLRSLRKKRKIVIIAGAGISTSAGVPDFRSSNGLFNSLKTQHKLKASGKQLFDASVYKDDTSTTSFHTMVRSLSQMVKNAPPTAFHHLVARLAQEGRLLRLYSQNVDGIDTSLPPLATEIPLVSKGPWPKTIQLHGGLEKMICTKCHTLSDFCPELFDGPVPPACGECVTRDQIRELESKRSHGIGRLRPRMVLYNEHNPDSDAIGAVTQADLKTRPDAVIVVGTTLKVPGVKAIAREMCKVVKDRRDGLTVWINRGTDPPFLFEDCWDLVVNGTSDEVADLAALRKWDDNLGDFREVTSHEVSLSKDRTGGIKIILDASRPSTSHGLPTPIDTPLMSPAPKPQMLPDSILTPRKAGLTQASSSLSILLQSGNIGLQKAAVMTTSGNARKALRIKSTAKSTITKRNTKPKMQTVKNAPKEKKSQRPVREGDISNAFKISKPTLLSAKQNSLSTPTNFTVSDIRAANKSFPMEPVGDANERLNTFPLHQKLSKFPNLKVTLETAAQARAHDEAFGISCVKI